MPNPVIRPLPDRDPVLLPDELLPHDAPVLLAAGTKAHQKGFDLLMPVFSVLAKRWPRLHLVLLGLSDQPYHGRNQQQWLRDRLRDHPDLSQRLLMPGPVGNMGAWYARATVFVLPSRYEGFPNVLLEAMAAGCACVARDCHTGPSDLIRDGDNGMLIASEAGANAWVSVLDRLLADPKRRYSIGQAATAVRDRYGEARLRRDFLDALDRLHHG